MSNKRNRRTRRVEAAQRDVTFYGSELDAAINGSVLAPTIRKQLYTVNEPRNHSLLSGPGEALPTHPLHCTIFRNFCLNCGTTHDTFGYLTRKVTESLPDGEGTITRYKAVSAGGVGELPATVERKLEKVPFCPHCPTISTKLKD
jgi:hypothetical protein